MFNYRQIMTLSMCTMFNSMLILSLHPSQLGANNENHSLCIILNCVHIPRLTVCASCSNVANTATSSLCIMLNFMQNWDSHFAHHAQRRANTETHGLWWYSLVWKTSTREAEKRLPRRHPSTGRPFHTAAYWRAHSHPYHVLSTTHNTQTSTHSRCSFLNCFM